MKKVIISTVLFLAAVAIIAGYMLYNKPHRNISSARTDFAVEAPELFREFQQDEEKANARYLDKVVKVRGTVKEVSTDEEGNLNVTLDAGNEMANVICEVPKEQEVTTAQVPVGSQQTLKGVCTGMLMDVVLVRCVLEEY